MPFFTRLIFLVGAASDHSMTMMDIAAGVLIGNLLTVSFVWGAYHFKDRDENDVPWIAYGSVLVPLGIAALSLIAAGASPN